MRNTLARGLTRRFEAVISELEEGLGILDILAMISRHSCDLEPIERKSQFRL
jgi:hypothetical protein